MVTDAANALGSAILLKSSVDELKSVLDAQCKAFLADKQVLAWILRDCAPEFKGLTIPQIMECIEGEPEIGTIPVDKDLTGQVLNEKITGLSDEDTSVFEGTVRYDIRFKVLAPKDDTVTEMIINVEAQNSTNPGYSLITRGIYYCGRMISAQMNTEFSHSNYDDLKKVHSIWICINPNRKELRGTMTTYSLAEHNVIGNTSANQSEYDKLQVTMVYLDKDFVNRSGIIGMLSTVFTNSLTAAEKATQLKDKYGMKVTDSIEGRLETMCNYSKGVYDAGKEEGMEKGVEKGILGTVDILKRMGVATSKIVEQLMVQYGLGKDEAAKYAR